MKHKRKTKSLRTAPKAHGQLWRVVDGAVADAFNCHPDYLARASRELTVRNSIVKRVVGGILSYAKERGAV